MGGSYGNTYSIAEANKLGWGDKILPYNVTDGKGGIVQNSGFASPALSVIGAGINAWGGMKALGLAEDQFDFQKDSWEKNFAMMQDQYYRKLNDRRASRATYGDMSQDEKNNIANHYDSGAQNVGAYPGATSSGFNNGLVGPTQANANMMDQATGGAPYSANAAQSMMNASPYTQGSAYVDNTAVDQGGEIRRARKKRANNGVADSAVAGVAGNQGTVAPKIR